MITVGIEFVKALFWAGDQLQDNQGSFVMQFVIFRGAMYTIRSVADR